MPDGTKRPVRAAVTSAFAAFGRGEATEGQQRLCLQYLLGLGNPFGFATTHQSEREVGVADGGRWLAVTIAKLVGGEQPFTLKHLGDMDDGSSDAS